MVPPVPLVEPPDPTESEPDMDRAPRTAPTTKKAPAKKAPAATPTRGPGRPKKSAQLADQLAAQIAGLGAMVTALGSTSIGTPAIEADGVAIIEHSTDIGAALAELAETNPKVKKALTASVSAGAWSGVLVAVAPLLLQIVGNHATLAPVVTLPDTNPEPFAGPDLPTSSAPPT